MMYRLIPVSPTLALTDSDWETIPAWRREQALRFTHAFGQYACVKTWLLLMDMLAECTGLSHSQLSERKVAYNTCGKPFFADVPDWHFSISHCRTALAVAVDDQPVGIDVESLRQPKQALVQRTMNANEQAQIAAAQDPAAAFTALWTRKEALLKLQGTGIRDDLQNVLADTHNVRITTFQHTDYICSIAEMSDE